MNFSATPFYDVNDPPRLDEFPSEISSYPYFNTSQTAFYKFVERSPARDETGSASHHSQAPSTGSHSSPTGAADSPGHTTGGGTTQPDIRNRELSDGSIVQVKDNVVRHRIIYYYFDHRAAKNVSNLDLYGWSGYLNAL